MIPPFIYLNYIKPNNVFFLINTKRRRFYKTILIKIKIKIKTLGAISLLVLEGTPLPQNPSGFHRNPNRPQHRWAEVAAPQQWRQR